MSTNAFLLAVFVIFILTCLRLAAYYASHERLIRQIRWGYSNKYLETRDFLLGQTDEIPGEDDPS